VPGRDCVLLVCIQIKAFALGLAMVAAFSLGLALTLVVIGVGVAWGSSKLAASWPGFERWSARLPYLSAGFVLAMGLALAAAGLNATGLLGPRRLSGWSPDQGAELVNTWFPGDRYVLGFCRCSGVPCSR